MKKEIALKIITDCAKDYHTYLENRNLLFLFGNPQKPDFFEATFLPRHFLHLTGVEVRNKHFFGSSDFYKKALKGKLSPDEFWLSDNGTTEMKLQVLPQLVKIYRSAKMVGEFGFTKSELYTEKLAGNITACLGFVRDDNFYVPNTALREDIRSISIKPQHRILAIYRKAIKDDRYRELCYLAKGISEEMLNLPRNIHEKMDLNGWKSRK